MALLATTLLGLKGHGAFVHVLLDLLVVLVQVIEDLILDGPLEEIELSNGRAQIHELDALPPTKGIEHLFAVRLEMALVCEVYNRVLAVLRQIGNVVLLCVIGHKPINESQTYARVSF